jgi:hypothetical protein
MADTSRASGFEIEEVRGSKRKVTLRGRALPYQGVAWEGSTRTKNVWYAGNTVATQQILGPEEEPTVIEGMWKNRFLRDTVQVVGFNQPNTALELVQVFETLRIAATELRVQWNEFVRYGIIKRFRVQVDRIQDIKWECEFEWRARNENVQIRAAKPPKQLPAIRSGMNKIDDILAFDPKPIFPDYRTQILSKIRAIRGQASKLFDVIRQVNYLVRTPAAVLGAMASAVESVRFEAEETIQQLVDVPRTTLTTSDRLADVLSIESWRMSLANSVHEFRGLAQRKERETVKQARPGALTIITVAQDTTLRQVSLDVYGTADNWQVIADFNQFVDSQVPAGTVVVVPPAPPAQGVRTRGDLQA